MNGDFSVEWYKVRGSRQMKLLFVEDEGYTRTGILQSVNWAGLGIAEVKVATDGQEGLMMARDFMPDILLSDVRMPHMNGTDMARSIRRFLPDCQIVFLSGFSDKEYLLSAIELSATAYVEKPIDILELEGTLKKVVARAQSERRQRERASKLIEVEQGNRLHLLLAKHGRFNELQEFLYASGFLDAVHIVAACGEDRGAALLDALDRRGLNDHRIVAYEDERPCTLILLAARSAYDDHALGECVRSYVKTGVTSACLYTDVAFNERLPVALNRAIDAARDELFFSRAHFEAPVGAMRTEDPVVPGDLPQLLLMGTDHALYRLCNLFDHPGLSGASQRMTEEVFEACRIIFTDARDFLEEWLGSGSMRNLWTTLYHITTFDELRRFLVEGFERFRRHLERVSEYGYAIQATQMHIRQFYADPNLTVERLAELVGLSVPYLSNIYKQKTKSTIKQQITRLRIEQAKALLDEGALRVMQIAEHVGYSNGNYFAKTFRRETGMSPNEYRERTREK